MFGPGTETAGKERENGAMRDIFLRSGKWRWTVAEDDAMHGPRLELVDPGAPQNKMAAPLPFSWRSLTNEQIEDLASRPEIRLWTDEHGIAWRITRVGPGTHFPYPFERPHLVFDSEQSFAGIVEIDPHARLGELTNGELRRYRDALRDFGARRKGFRPPDRHDA